MKKTSGFSVNKKWGVFTLFLMSLLMVPSVKAAPLAEVNKTPIHENEVDTLVQTYLRQIGHQKLSPMRMASIRKEVLKKLIEEELLYQSGLENDLRVTEEEVKAGIQKIQNRFESVDAFYAALSEQTLNLEDIRKGVVRSILIQKSWERYLKMPESERSHRLQEMAQRAEIQLFGDGLTTSADDQ